MRLFLRAFILTILRFAVILAMVLAVENFDFSPLPVWTAVVLVYLLHFAITYAFGLWTFRGLAPSQNQIIIVAAEFLVFGTLWEALFYLFASQGTWRDLAANYHWQSLYIIAIYLAAVLLAGYRMRRKHIKATLPEGLEA